MTDSLAFSPQALSVFERHYYQRSPDGELLEHSPADVFARIRNFYLANGLGEKEKIADKMFDMQMQKRFAFNSPVYYNACTTNTVPQLSACWIGSLADSMTSITEHLTRACMVFQAGAGIGFNIGALRPKGASIGDGGTKRTGTSGSSGPISFMRMFQAAGDTVMSAGKRRAAMWVGMAFDHPDIIEFIRCKRGENRLRYTNMNTTVIVDDNVAERIFSQMRNADFSTQWVKTPWETITIGQLLDEIVQSIWAGGDPGLMFIDEINRHNTTPAYGRIVSFNPCVAGDTIVQTTGGAVSIVSLASDPIPFDLFTGSGKRTRGRAFCTGIKRVINVVFNTGQKLTCTPDHKFMTPRGKYAVNALEVGAEVYLAGHFGTARITGITAPNEPIHVYDITVEHDEHTFIANGLSVSNCGEICLPPDSSCNLGAICLYNALLEMEKYGVAERGPTGCFCWNDFREEFLTLIKDATRCAMEHLDVNIDVTAYPDHKFEKSSKAIRATGLGISGFGELLFALGITYGSDDACVIAAEIMNTITLTATQWSFEAAQEKGCCPAAEEPENRAAMRKQIEHYITRCADYSLSENVIDEWTDLLDRVDAPPYYRNSYVTCIAPTGNTGLAIDAYTGGMEPAFALSFERNTRDGRMYFADREFEIQASPSTTLLEDLYDGFRGSLNLEHFDIDALDESTVELLVDKHGEDWSKRIESTTCEILTLSTRVREIFVTMHDIPPAARIAQQAALQAFTSLSISSTINVPHETTPAQISEIIQAACAPDKGLKGITLYRDGSIQFAPVTLTKDKKGALPDTMPGVSGISNADTQVIDLPSVKSAAAKVDYAARADETEYGKIMVRKPRQRPTHTRGKTIELKFPTAFGELKYYITINQDPNQPGYPVEVFINGGRSGDNVPALLQAIGRLISGWLQDGGPVQKIVKKLVGIKSPDTAVLKLDPSDEKPSKIYSIPDGVGRILQRDFLDNQREVQSVANGINCHMCYHNTLVYAADGRRCWQCKNPDCGYSAC